MKVLLQLAALFTMLAVALGAFGAHGLSSKLPPERLAIFETGVRYQFYHALAIFIAVLLFKWKSSGLLLNAGWSFVVGTVLFSGSLYLLATRDLLGIESWSRVLGPITPLGGLAFLIGWLLIVVAVSKSF